MRQYDQALRRSQGSTDHFGSEQPAGGASLSATATAESQPYQG